VESISTYLCLDDPSSTVSFSCQHISQYRLYTLVCLATTRFNSHDIPLYRDKSFPICEMELCRLLTMSPLAEEADTGNDLSLQGAARANRSASGLWNLKEVRGAHQSEVLGLVLPGLRSHMCWILPRIGIKTESIRMQGFRETLKRRYGFLPQRCRAPVGCPS